MVLRVERPHPVRVAIDGPDAAGKTTLADELDRFIERSGRPVIRASIDGFHRPQQQRSARGAESPAGYFYDSFDYPGLRAALLDPLGPGGSLKFRRRIFDYRTDQPVDSWDFSVFLAVPFAETQRRAAVRDMALFDNVDAARHRYAVRYVPGQQLYFDLARPQQKADVVIDNEDPQQPRLRAGGSQS